MTPATILHNTDASRYELSLENELVGFVEYRDEGPRRVFTHTEVEPDEQGHGYATKLIAFALDDCLAADIRVVAECPMVADHLSDHSEYDDIVDAPKA